MINMIICSICGLIIYSLCQKMSQPGWNFWYQYTYLPDLFVLLAAVIPLILVNLCPLSGARRH